MKKVLLILALVLSANAWAEEDELPMKLTCETGGDILYVYVAEDIYKSWFQFHPSSNSNLFYKFGTEKLFVSGSKRMKRRGSSFINENNIRLYRFHANRPISFGLNRLTMKTARGGQCFKGFKEYK